MTNDPGWEAAAKEFQKQAINAEAYAHLLRSSLVCVLHIIEHSEVELDPELQKVLRHLAELGEYKEAGWRKAPETKAVFDDA